MVGMVVMVYWYGIVRRIKDVMVVVVVVVTVLMTMVMVVVIMVGCCVYGSGRGYQNVFNGDLQKAML